MRRAPAPVLEENDDEAEKMEQFRLRQMKGQTPPRKMRKKSLAPVDVNGLLVVHFSLFHLKRCSHDLAHTGS